MATGRGWSRKVCRHTLACFAKIALVGYSCLHEWARRLTGESEYELLFLGVFVVILFFQFLDSSVKTLFLNACKIWTDWEYDGGNLFAGTVKLLLGEAEGYPHPLGYLDRWRSAQMLIKIWSFLNSFTRLQSTSTPASQFLDEGL